MTEAEARAWAERLPDVPRETPVRIEQFLLLLMEESARQNLVSPGDMALLWSRHVADSLQLLLLARRGSWIDIGTGAGFPGMIIGLAQPDRPVVLVEQRAKRAAFLKDAAETLGAANIEVHQQRVEQVRAGPFAIISARAFAPLSRLLPLALHLSDSGTRWLLPKGRIAAMELAEARASWHGSFRLERSVTDPDSAIIVAERVGRKVSR